MPNFRLIPRKTKGREKNERGIPEQHSGNTERVLGEMVNFLVMHD